MEQMQLATNTVLEQIVRFLQLIGIPIMGVLFIAGMLILLTSGKNPRRRRAGYIMTIAFGIGILLVAYVPLLAYEFGGDEPWEATGDESIESMVDSSSGLGAVLFKGIKYGAIPLTFSMFYLGMLVVLLAAKSPQRKRLGIGIMILCPIVLTVVFVLPLLLPQL